jgi:hypothetical protein
MFSPSSLISIVTSDLSLTLQGESEVRQREVERVGESHNSMCIDVFVYRHIELRYILHGKAPQNDVPCHVAVTSSSALLGTPTYIVCFE